ncbi:MAG: tripartite tricarboxylate transporter substrate binding protein [Acetobacteraceae bacterium]|nr:MAG: tripartite tricarboxylate transporter substrate binding protein [Acetobacteraceae bacterium]
MGEGGGEIHAADLEPSAEHRAEFLRLLALRPVPQDPRRTLHLDPEQLPRLQPAWPGRARPGAAAARGAGADGRHLVGLRRRRAEVRRRALLGAALLPVPALGQGIGDFPNRPVRLICPYSAGGIADTVARIVQSKTGEALGQQLVIENRTGASGALGAAAAAQAPADGYTLVMEGATTITSPLVNKSLPLDYDMLLPITQLTSAPYVLGMRAGFPATDLRGFLAEAQRRPGEVTFGTPGVAHIGHLMGELMQAMAGVKMEHIPYRGGADVARDVAAGRLDACFISESSFRPVVESGRGKVIGLTGAGRRANMPEVPAIGEVLPGYELTTWILVFCPVGTPEPIQARLSTAFQAATGDAATRAKLDATGSDAVVAGPAEAQAVFRRDKAVIGRLMREAGLLVAR